VKQELDRIEIPGEHEARGRAWSVVAAAFAERGSVERPSRRPRPAIAIAVALAVAALAAVLSPPGRAVLGEIRDVVGIEHAQPALFSLPAPGNLLVASDAGIWVVHQDGSKRLLGPYREASWSPFGRFVVVARENELAALEPDGNLRWTLTRPQVSSPRWTGTETNTRIAYSSRAQPRVVAGDGMGDQPVCAVSARRVPPAWRPGTGFVLALVAPSGGVYTVDLEGCVVSWGRRPTVAGSRRIEWSGDASRLVVVASDGIRVLDARTGRVTRTLRGREAAFRPGGRGLAVLRQHGGSSEIAVGDQVVFRAEGLLRGLTWSPDGRWMLVSWPAADQWVFVRADGSTPHAVANVSEQFRSRSFPRVEGWCCEP